MLARLLLLVERDVRPIFVKASSVSSRYLSCFRFYFNEKLLKFPSMFSPMYVYHIRAKRIVNKMRAKTHFTGQFWQSIRELEWCITTSWTIASTKLLRWYSIAPFVRKWILWNVDSVMHQHWDNEMWHEHTWIDELYQNKSSYCYFNIYQEFLRYMVSFL